MLEPLTSSPCVWSLNEINRNLNRASSENILSHNWLVNIFVRKTLYCELFSHGSQMQRNGKKQNETRKTSAWWILEIFPPKTNHKFCIIRHTRNITQRKMAKQEVNVSIRLNFFPFISLHLQQERKKINGPVSAHN